MELSYKRLLTSQLLVNLKHSCKDVISPIVANSFQTQPSPKQADKPLLDSLIEDINIEKMKSQTEEKTDSSSKAFESPTVMKKNQSF